MRRFYFDLRDGDALAPDGIGLELPDAETAQEEAAIILARMAVEAVPIVLRHGGHTMAIEIRDDAGPVVRILFTFTADQQDRRH